ncbi:leucine-rich repeat-containing protein 73-like [Mantella aurantiaca]
MLPGSIQMSGETLSGAEVKGVCEGLTEGTVRLLSLRGCLLSDRDFARLCQGVAQSPSFVQLNLNLGVVSSASRIQQLAQSLHKNRSLQSLFLHGNPLTNPALAGYPSMVSLDLGDCLLGDEGISLICGLLPPDGAKPGERTICPSTRLSSILMDMIQNYPTPFRSLVLSENNISEELQQQITDLLCAGEEEEESEGAEPSVREKRRSMYRRGSKR